MHKQASKQASKQGERGLTKNSKVKNCSSAGLQPCKCEAKASRCIGLRIDLLAVLYFLFLTSLCYAQNEERLTLTTYYPAPYGTYQQLVATDKFLVCDTVDVAANLADMVDGDAVFMGNMGIGTTDPGSRLEILGDSGVNTYLQVHRPSRDAGQVGLELGVDINDRAVIYQPTDSQDLRFFIRSDSGGTDRMTITGNGNVGIGITNPVIDLAIGDNDTGLHQQGDGELAIVTNGTERVRIDDVGNVGIGTTNPGEDLSIAGNGSAIELGADVAGKEVNAGKIAYQRWSGNALDIVGAGTSGNRRVRFYAEAGTSFDGYINSSTGVFVNSAPVVTGVIIASHLNSDNDATLCPAGWALTSAASSKDGVSHDHICVKYN